MNDDLGSFPTPSNTQSASYTPPSFEPTPDEIPSPATPNLTTLETPKIENFFPEIDDKKPEPIFTSPIPSQTPTPPEPIMANNPPVAKSSSPLISIVLLLVAGVGISGSVFLYSQSSALKKQLTDITKTLEQQKTIITPSPTPTVIDIPTPTPTDEMTPEITPTPTASISSSVKEVIPLALAPQALKVGINKEPNAQLILIKAENTQDSEKVLTKYFFRNSLTNKKYFYISINGKNESEINDNAIYVNPDNNIPSLNDLVLGNKLGIDYKEALKIASSLYTFSQPDYPINAQFIKSGPKTIWQITLDTADKKYIVQIDSTTKEVLFKTPAR